MAVSKYSKSEQIKLSQNFKLSEFSCKGNGCCSQTLVDSELINLLQAIRNHFKKPVVINSAYRCKIHNKAVGGTASSRHMQGMAADIVISGVAPKKVAELAQTLGAKGIILYEDKGFVHIDTRSTKYYAITKNSGTTRVTSFIDDACPYTKPSGNIRRGSKGEEVKWVQWYLNKLGYDCGKVDGICGSKTVKAITQFQISTGLVCDGICGVKTTKKLEESL